MATQVHVPRVNNNDDEVILAGLSIAQGQAVRRGQVLAQVETDKAVQDVLAPADGHVLCVAGRVGDKLGVGKVFLWLGEPGEEILPEEASAPAASSRWPTAKARILLQRHGLEAAEVSGAGERLTEADVQRHLAHRVEVISPGHKHAQPGIGGRLVELRSDERGMLATVSWQRDEAVPGYVEIAYDPEPWEACARAFGEQHRLLLNPLQALMLWRLVRIAGETPRLNATLVGRQRLEYDVIHPGFTVQAGDTLYLAVLRNAGELEPLPFVQAMADLQRRAAGNRLGVEETRGATLGFSSMARWKVSRHIPVLPPHTSFMVAHAAGPQAILGATYDHRVLSGSDAVNALTKLSNPLI